MPHSAIGETLGGRYELESLLGQGGMSAVYRATDPNLRRQVAIKLIHTHLSANPSFVGRFKEEAAAVARLRHPNIVQVHDFNSDQETYYMVMEYLVGETLQERLRRLDGANRHMPYEEAIQIGCQMCDAIGYAHKRELIHRDVKPANIMIDVHGQAILMDFGIVKIIGGEYHTATGATIGTASYMSPEQIRGERADERSDIYSLAVTLYEMVSRRTPFQADSAMGLMMMVLNDPLPDLFELRRGIPAPLVEVVEKGMAKDPGARFQTMAEMAAALSLAEEAAAQVVPSPTVAEEKPERPEEDEAHISAMVEREYSPPPPPAPSAAPDQAQTRRRRSVLPTAVDPPAQPASGSVATPSEQKHSVVKQIEYAREAAPPQTKHSSSRNTRRLIFIIFLLLLPAAAVAAGDFVLRTQREPTYETTSVAQSARSINAANAKNVVSLGRWETNAVVEEIAIAPDGKTIGTASNRDLMGLYRYRYYSGLWRSSSGRLDYLLRDHENWVNSVAFSHDGQFFVSASEDDTATLWYAAIGSRARRIEASSGGITSIDFSPNNLLLATGSWNGTVGVWQVEDGHLLRSLAGHQDGVTDVVFSPDGEHIASASDDLSIKLWQVSDGAQVYSLTGHAGSIRRLAFSGDGSWLASASADNSVRIWRVTDGTLVRTLTGHSQPVLDVAFAPDGSLLASASSDGSVRLWRADNGDELLLLGGDLESVTSVAFTPDGGTLISAEISGAIRFWGLSEAIPQQGS